MKQPSLFDGDRSTLADALEITFNNVNPDGSVQPNLEGILA